MMPLSVAAFGLVLSTRVMTELRSEISDLNPRSMLDFGSGPGTAALAVWDVWGMEGGNKVDEDGEERWEEGDRNLQYDFFVFRMRDMAVVYGAVSLYSRHDISQRELLLGGG